MGLILENSTTEIFYAVIIVLWSLYSYVTQHYNYWKERGVPYLDAVFPLGTLSDVSLGRTHIGEAYNQCYKKVKGERYFGVIAGRNPTLVIKDPELIKHVLTKNFSHFTDRVAMPKACKKDYIAHHLFNLMEPEWRKMRLILAPTFTSGKMKMMYSLMEKCADHLSEHMDETDSVVDVKDILGRFTMDVIATCALGLEINSLSDKNCEFFKVGMQIFKTNKFRMARRIWYDVVPILAKLYAPPIVPPNISDFFTKIINDTVSFREENGVVRNDFLHLLIKIRQNRSVLDNTEKINGEPEVGPEVELKQTSTACGLTIEEITAQSFVFFAAGFETASSTAAFCLYELACNPNIQERLHEEISKILKQHGGKPTYQALQEMTYMDQVINETLRCYASLSVLTRICTEPYKIPDSELTIEKGTKVVIPVYAIHHDPEYYPEPYKFDPERFTPERVKERHPYLHIPFGEGPRMCIGMRFGLMQTKIALTTMVSSYKFSLTQNTDVPIRIDPTGFTTMPEKSLLLHASKRNITY